VPQSRGTSVHILLAGVSAERGIFLQVKLLCTASQKPKPEHANKNAGGPRSAGLPGRIDCVYFLMWPGWKQELRSNRWHYAKRWSHAAPVVLVQPDLSPNEDGAAESELEPQIPNCRILRIESQDSDSPLMVLNQILQIQADLEAHRFHRPLLWLYNPKLVSAYCALPAVARVVHATENHFEYSDLPARFQEQLRTCLELSDLVVAVSSGVSRGVAANVPQAKVATVSNGCEYRVYAAGTPDPELTALRQGYRKLAIYAGNINLRIDFGLLLSCAESYPDTLFVLVGPVKGTAGPNLLAPPDQVIWECLLQTPNVRHLNAVDPDRLPHFYAAADIGIIPYKDLRVIRESGFALKALEMLATGLPVVSTMMKPLAGLTAGLFVVDDSSAFREAVGTLRRDALSPQAKAEMDALCRANDYDEKFRQVLAILDEIVQPDRMTTTHNPSLVAELRKELCPLQSLRTSYREDRQNLVNEIERLQKVWREQNEWFNEQIHNVQEVVRQLQSEIHRLQAAHGEAIQQRDEAIQQRDEAIQQRETEIARLAAEIHYYRRFRIAVKRIPGVAVLLRSLPRW
jgi:glycosyltransferase involved in cell wall biosynthesis